MISSIPSPLRFASAGLLLSGIATAGAQVIFSDSSDFTNWYQGGTALTLTKGLELVKSGSSATSGFEVIGRSFAEVTLSVGQTLTLSFDWTQSSSSAGIIRVGLYDIANPITGDNWTGASLGAYDGYGSFLRDASGSANAARRESGAAISSANAPLVAGTNFGSSTNNVNLADDGSVTYNVSFTVTRSGAAQIDTLLDISEGELSVLSVAGTQSSGILDTFNGAFIRTSGGTSTFDNIEASVIPEPSSALLAGLGLLGLMLRRR